MKKIAILTLYGNNNYGNKLQNYAVQNVLEKIGFEAVTIRNNVLFNNEDNKKNSLKFILSFVKHTFIIRDGIYTSFLANKRTKRFYKFNKHINYSKRYFKYNRYLNFDYYIVGSDQVWNPYIGLSDFGLLNYIKDNNKKISFSASFGIDKLPNLISNQYKNSLIKFNKISVREEKGKEIIEKLTGRKDVEVLIDPTMLLATKEWDKIVKKPKKIDILKGKKYILVYFLGEISKERSNEINRIAKENNCDIINILDKNDPLYISGPSEFLYLEKNAFLICTDSFHSSVFAILYDRPFIVFDREQNGIENMNSRIDTLINKFKLKNRRYNGNKITKENLEHDYTEAYKILKLEKKKSMDFLKKALDEK